MPPFLSWVTFGPGTWYVLLITFKILKTFGGFDSSIPCPLNAIFLQSDCSISSRRQVHLGRAAAGPATPWSGRLLPTSTAWVTRRRRSRRRLNLKNCKLNIFCSLRLFLPPSFLPLTLSLPPSIFRTHDPCDHGKPKAVQRRDWVVGPGTQHTGRLCVRARARACHGACVHVTVCLRRFVRRCRDALRG